MPENLLKTWLDHLDLFYQVVAVQSVECKSPKVYQVVYLDVLVLAKSLGV